MASCTIDNRTKHGQTEKDVKALLDAALAKAAKGNKNYKSDYEFILSELPVACPPNHPILDALDKAAGEKLLRRGVNYYTDASVLVGDSNLPMVIYGPGDDKQAHQPNEHISLTKYYKSIEVYKNFMCDFCIEA